jgi:hypothetical protein
VPPTARERCAMKQRMFTRLSLGLAATLIAAVTVLTATPAMAAETQSGQTLCSPPPLSQLFLSYNDTSWYTLLAGETTNGFDGDGWQLGGGAQIIITQLSDGQVGPVLDLPGGSVAVSPPVCVSSSFTTARTMMRTPARNDGVSVYISSADAAWNGLRNLGQVRGSGTEWTAPDSLSLQPAIRGGWQRVRFTLVPRGARSEYQLYNFGLDPRMK